MTRSLFIDKCLCNFTFVLLAPLVLCTVARGNEFPTGWEDMEIEAKWDATEAVFNSIISAFPDNGSKYGYDLNVRWSGIPRRYVDVYYDNNSAELFNSLHMIRHRQRSQTSASIAITNSFADLGSTSIIWNQNWEKVQYKSTPTRIGAVWFRNEQGAAQLDATQVTETLGGTAPMPPYTLDDNPVQLLLDDHPGFDFNDLEEVLQVVQYRYRVEFEDPSTGDPLYEISLDKIVTTPSGQPSTESYGVELEVLRDDGEPNTEPGVEQLLELMLTMEAEFALTRATSSKGGVEVPDSAEPVMMLETTTLDYGEIELGFAHTKAIVVHNDGLAPLTFSVVNPGDPDQDQFVITTPTNLTIDVGGPPVIVEQTYEPDVQSIPHAIELEVTGNDSCNPVETITLQGEGTSPIAIKSLLVLDRSGSMNSSAGDRIKIEAMRDAVELYADLLRESVGDELGLVRYNHNNDVYLGLNLVDAGHMADVADKLSDAALLDFNRLQPTGATGIGGAMLTAAGELPASTGGLKHVMVVLTDGMENQTPWIEDAVDQIEVTNPELSLYSVGVGDDIEPDKLQLITNRGAGGYHQVSGDLSGITIFDLEAFYFKIFANADGQDLAIDPTVMVPLGGSTPIDVHQATITSSDRKAVFLALDSPELREHYRLELVAPNGHVMTPGTSVAGIGIHYRQHRTYTIYKVLLSNSAQAEGYLGDWVLRLTPRRAEIQNDVRSPARQQLAPIGFNASVDSNYHMRVSLHANRYLPGEPISVYAKLTEKGNPVSSARVWAQVTGPDKRLDTRIALYDDGTRGDRRANDGIYTAVFGETQTSGVYRFLVRSHGSNVHRENVPREATRYASMVAPER